ncbi:MAG: enoyl-CoA hydratase-related protein [Candidatus Binatia bacterium]
MIEVVTSGGISRLTLDRPESRNALNGEVMALLGERLDAIEADDSVRIVIVTGAGEVFSAGADLNAMKRAQAVGEDENRRDAAAMGALFHRLAAFPRPVIARVNGPAIGGGVGLMAACDVVVADERAFFAFSEVRLGLVPAVISPFCVGRLGASRARRLFLTGERFDAASALHWGLVDEVAASGKLDEFVERLCGRLLKGGPLALAEAKRLIERVANSPASEVLDYTSDLIARLRVSREALEGMAAFLEKRSPQWSP